MERRQIRKPKRYGDWEEGGLKLPSEKVKEKLWEIEDILDRKGSGAEEKVLVKWADWEGLPTWVELSYNLELKTYLTKNRANPHACTLIKNELRGQSETALDIYETDLYALRQAVFDSLSDVRYTPEGSVGRQTRVSIKVPFRKDEFDRTFGRVLRQKFGATGNDQCHATLEELNQVFGDAKWASRQYQTSTETFISPREFIHVSWGYKERLQYDHAECERCHWEGLEANRPELCNPAQSFMCGPPWLQLTFTRARRNMVTGDVSRKR